MDHTDTLSGALAGFKPEPGDSSRGRTAVLLSKGFASGSTVWTPYVSVSGVGEFDGMNSYTIDGNFSATTSTKGTRALVEGRLSVRTGKLSVFGGVNWQDGAALKSFVGGQIGLRYTLRVCVVEEPGGRPFSLFRRGSFFANAALRMSQDTQRRFAELVSLNSTIPVSCPTSAIR